MKKENQDGLKWFEEKDMREYEEKQSHGLRGQKEKRNWDELRSKTDFINIEKKYTLTDLNNRRRNKTKEIERIENLY